MTGESSARVASRVLRPPPALFELRQISRGELGREAASSGEACWCGLMCFLVLIVRRGELNFACCIRVPITDVAIEDRTERRDDFGHVPGERAQHGLQQRLAA